jgi:hypothetical protein
MVASWTRRSAPAESGCGWRRRSTSRRGPATQRPRGRGPVAGDPDVGQPVASCADRRRDGRHWRPRVPVARTASSARRSWTSWPRCWTPARWCGAGPISVGRWPHRRGRAGTLRRGLHPGRAGPAAAPAGLKRAGARPPSRRAQGGADQRLAGEDLAGDKRTAADLGAWLVFEDESGHGAPGRRRAAPGGAAGAPPSCG